MWQTLRDVILSHDAEKSVDTYVEQFNRFDDAWLAAEWLLARTPQIGTQNTNFAGKYWLYVQASDVLAGTPEIWIVYSFSAKQVVVHGIRAEIREDEDQAD